MDITVTSNEKLKKAPQFHKVVELLDKLDKGAILGRLSGNCIASCDMVQTMLSQSGIECEIVECQACIHREGETLEFFFVGYDDTAFAGQVDTHLVVVTKTKIPMLIDVSISHLLPYDHPYIVEELKEYADGNIIGDYTYSNFKLTYQKKKVIRIPNIHQKTLLGRITEEMKFRNLVHKLVWIVWLGLSLSAVNFILNMTLLSVKLIKG